VLRKILYEGKGTLNTVRLKGKGQRGKVSNTFFTLSPLTFSQTTRDAYPKRIEGTLNSKKKKQAYLNAGRYSR
jgi:hypothetical protein